MKARVLTLTLLVAGCVGTSIPLNDAVTASVLSRANNQFEVETMTIRSFKKDANGQRSEFSGAVCSGKNARISFRRVTTPGALEVPTYLQAERFPNRGKPPAITVECRYEGRTIAVRAEASSAVGNAVVHGDQIHDPSTGTTTIPVKTVLNSRLSTTLPWRYPSVDMEF